MTKSYVFVVKIDMFKKKWYGEKWKTEKSHKRWAGVKRVLLNYLETINFDF